MQRYKKEEFDCGQLVALTSLEAKKFMSLLSVFSRLWEKHHNYYDLKGARHKISKFREDAPA